MMPAAPVPPQLNLVACDQEPIRIPGSIQPHGFLLALPQDGERRVVQASANLAQHTGVVCDEALGQALPAILGERAALQLETELARTELGVQPTHLGTVLVGNDRYFDVLAHVFDHLLLLEFESVSRATPPDFRHLYPKVGSFLLKINDVHDIVEMSTLAAQQIRDVTGFGRVMVYQFDRDGHGHVLAESLADGYGSYLGQRFPASDIPRQARELYMLNHIRLIQDANYVPARLVPAVNPLTQAPNDLSYAALRSVSPIHLQYMRNMGTLASMSVSLIVKGQLWGLISCHNATAMPAAFEQRTVCEQLGQILALRIESRSDAGELEFRLEVRRTMVSMLAGLSQHKADFADSLCSVFPELLRFARASGAAIVVDDRVLTYGDAPEEQEVRELVRWLGANAHGEVFHTDQLSVLHAPALACRRNASGLLSMSISRIHPHYLLWFRPEVVRTIDWAGQPQDKRGQGQLTPRSSFASWRETIHGISAPWHDGEIELAAEFRGALLGIVLERAEQMAELAEELGRANKELEAFSYSVSHDLRAPLRHIAGFSDLLMETAGADDLEKRRRFLKNIKDSARLAGKLVDDLLSFSQMGRAALHPCKVNMTELVRACIQKLALDTRERQVEWDIGALPSIKADPTFVQLALYNLLSNAVKFTSHQEVARIAVSATENAQEVAFHVADNGAGFNMEYVHKLFGVFQRLHRMEDFPGTGIGLANVRRIIERHGGRVWAVSTPGLGATFSFSIPKDFVTQG